MQRIIQIIDHILYMDPYNNILRTLQITLNHPLKYIDKNATRNSIILNLFADMSLIRLNNHHFKHHALNSSPPGQNGHHFADDIFRCILVSENFCISIEISLKFDPRSPIYNKPAFGLDNGLVPNRWQAVIWNNADPIHWCIYAALGGDELTLNSEGKHL